MLFSAVLKIKNKTIVSFYYKYLLYKKITVNITNEIRNTLSSIDLCNKQKTCTYISSNIK